MGDVIANKAKRSVAMTSHHAKAVCSGNIPFTN